MLALGLTIVLATTGAIVPSRPALGASTTLSIIAGLVEARHGAAGYVTATEGEVLEAGDAVRTGADGRAVLTYFDGSTVEIEPSSELAIEEATIGTDGSTTIEMTQVIGHTWHVVERQLSPASKYEVHTNAATAVVRGTTFEVLVEPDEAGEPRTTVLTAKGTVAMKRAATFASAGEEVLVPEGRQAEARPGRRLEPAQQRPEADRVVTVTLGSERSVVVDPLGRANGLRDGKLVLETPGAKVERVDGKLVITLPNIPEGRLSAQVDRRGDEDPEEVVVETKVKERGRDETRAEEKAFVPRNGRANVDLDVKRGERPEVKVRPENARSTASPTPTATGPGLRLPTVPPLASPEGAGERGAGERSADPARTQPPRRTQSASRTTSPRATGVPSVRLSPLPTLSSERGSDRAAEQRADKEDRASEPKDEPKREPSRIPPDFKLPELPGRLGNGGGKDR